VRPLTSSVALLLVLAPALATVPAAHADTGGPRLYYVDQTGVFTATAAHPGQRSRVPKPHPSDAPVYPEQAVPSPNGSRIAISTHVRRNSGQRIYVAGPRGQHPRLVASFDNDPDAGPNWTIDSIAWQGEHRLYFSIYRGTGAPVIDTIRVPAHGAPGPVREVPNSTGLYGLTVDPTADRLAAVITDAGSCDGTNPKVDPDIMVLNLETHQRRRLVKVTPTQADACFTPGSLAWSPDGSRLAFSAVVHARKTPQLLMRAVETVPTGAHQSHQPRIESPRKGHFSAGAVAWQSTHSLWFVAANDLYSIRVRQGGSSAPHRRTHSPSALKFRLSFG